MRPTLLAPLVAAALVLGACGDDDSGTSAEGGDETAEAGDGLAVQTGQTDLGEVLTDDAGLTLYAFTEDTEGVSTCEDACATTWPPLAVDGEELPEGLDPEVFRVTTRPDGSFQLAAGDFPLYRFAGDTGPGDANGQGSGGVWFALTPEGELIQDAATDGEDSGSSDGY